MYSKWQNLIIITFVGWGKKVLSGCKVYKDLAILPIIGSARFRCENSGVAWQSSERIKTKKVRKRCVFLLWKLAVSWSLMKENWRNIMFGNACNPPRCFLRHFGCALTGFMRSELRGTCDLFKWCLLANCKSTLVMNLFRENRSWCIVFCT